uniref:Jasmintide 13 n=1 Tax=Jasminum sambac TaxID=660624 RepID=A0A2K9QL66_9LAMI|nr:jasmintide 13 precursor [Jasminum sambac]
MEKASIKLTFFTLFLIALAVLPIPNMRQVGVEARVLQETSSVQPLSNILLQPMLSQGKLGFCVACRENRDCFIFWSCSGGCCQ